MFPIKSTNAANANLDSLTIYQMEALVDGHLKVENTDFTVNRTTGVVTFNETPPKDVEVIITYSKTKILRVTEGLMGQFIQENKEDIMQIGYMVLYKSSYMYNVYNSSMFYTYFKNAFEKAIITEIRNNNTNKKYILNNAISYDIDIPNNSMSYLDIIGKNDNYEDMEYTKFMINFKNSMTYDLGCIFEMYYNGYNKEEISTLLDIDISKIKKYISEIKKHALTYRYLFLK